MLPKIYTLRKVPVVGHLLHTVPSSINCPSCGRETEAYENLDLVIDSWPRCDFIAASGGAYFMSEKLLHLLKSIHARGYVDHPVRIQYSDDFYRTCPDAKILQRGMPLYKYVVFTCRCDGPWILHSQGPPCERCGLPVPRVKDMGAITAEILGDIEQQRILVFPETWHGEDFFYLSEPGSPIVTERIADILEETGNLRKEKVENSEIIRRLMPNYAEQLEKVGWQKHVCSQLGPAGWVKER